MSDGTGPISTINISDTSVTPGSYTNTNLTVNQQGQITNASSGTSPTILEIDSGTGITVVNGTGPTATINISDTSVSPASYTFTNLTVNQQGQITGASSGTPIITVAGVPLHGLTFTTSSGNVTGSLQYNGFSVWKTRDQSIAASTVTTALPWTTTNPTSSSVIGYNTGTCLNLTTGVFTCPTGGLWQFEGRVVWASGTTATTRTSRFILNNTSAVDGDTYQSTGDSASNKLFSSIILSAGDTIVLSVFQSSGSALNNLQLDTSSGTGTRFSGRFCGVL